MDVENSSIEEPKDPFSWLVTQNEELKSRIKSLETELYHWKVDSTDTKERLRRIYLNRNKQNYIDSFYDSNVKKLINSLTEQNVFLKKELSIKDLSSLSELRNRIEQLGGELKTKTQENELLENEMKILKCPEDVYELKCDVETLRSTNMKIRRENMNIKKRLDKQLDIGNYLRSEFSKQRKEYIKIFTQAYLEHGDDFIQQLKSLDGSDTVPEFLSKPMNQDISTSTEDLVGTSSDITCKKSTDSYADSGIDTLPDEFRELMKNSQLEEANEKIRKLEVELRLKNKDSVRMDDLLKSISEDHRSRENRSKNLETELIRTQKELIDVRDQKQVALNEVLSLQTIIKVLTQENQFPQRRQSPPRQQQRTSLPFESRTISSRDEMKEPHQLAPWTSMTNPRAIPVRDVASKGPIESRDISKLSPRGPGIQLSQIPPIPTIPSIPTVTPIISSAPREIYMSASVSQPQRVHCEKCDQDIAVEEYQSHIMFCG